MIAELTDRTEGLAGQAISIHDNFLKGPAADEILAWLDRLGFRSVHAEGWRSVWRLTGVDVLRGPTWSVARDGQLGPEGPIPEPLQPLAHQVARLVLPPETGWMVSLTPWIYPVGAGLGLHRDDRRYHGAFAYYLTPEWDLHWGGLLLAVADEGGGPPLAHAVFNARAERDSVALAGRGAWIMPAWNRLVVIPPGLRHSVTRVEAAAGDRARISIAGFIHRRSELPAGGVARDSHD